MVLDVIQLPNPLQHLVCFSGIAFYGIEELPPRMRQQATSRTADWTGLKTLTQAKADLANAQADAADTSEAKVLVLTEAAKEQAEVVRITELRTPFICTKADVDRERLRLLDYKIRLLRIRQKKDKKTKGVGSL